MSKPPIKFTIAVEMLKAGTLIKKKGKLWEVDISFVWYIDYKNKRLAITIPKGFIFDFGSIPQQLRWHFNPTEYLAYLLHDNMYSLLIEYKDDEYEYNIQREFADNVMREALKVEGMGRIDRYIVRKGCRIFGGIYQKYLRYKEGKITKEQTGFARAINLIEFFKSLIN